MDVLDIDITGMEAWVSSDGIFLAVEGHEPTKQKRPAIFKIAGRLEVCVRYSVLLPESPVKPAILARPPATHTAATAEPIAERGVHKVKWEHHAGLSQSQ